MIEDALLEGEEMMEKALGALRNEFSKIRSGRANPELFTSLIVDYYGSPTQMQQIA